jgi:Flp pilus assembly protein TadD
MLGRVHMAAREHVDAAAMFRRAAALDPAMPGTRLRLGDALAASGDEAGARAAWEAALAQEGDRAGGRAAAARLVAARLRGQDGAAGAIAFARDWLSRVPGDARVRFQLAALLIDAGRLPEALAETETLHRLAPDDPAVLNNLAWLLGETGDARALDLARRAHALAPADPSIADTLGWLLVVAGDTQSGLGHLRAAAAAAPTDARIRLRLAEALARTGDAEEARRLARALLAERPGHEGAQGLLRRLD